MKNAWYQEHLTDGRSNLPFSFMYDGQPSARCLATTNAGCRTRLYRNRFGDPALWAALPKTLRVCRLNMRHGTARMLSHRYLDTASPLVQETTFSTGLRVVANFSDEPFVVDGKTVPARSALTEE